MFLYAVAFRKQDTANTSAVKVLDKDGVVAYGEFPGKSIRQALLCFLERQSPKSYSIVESQVTTNMPKELTVFYEV